MAKEIQPWLPKLLIFFTIFVVVNDSNSLPISEAPLLLSKGKGIIVYTTCILTPPTTPEQITICTALYAVYVASLQVLNAPLPLIPSIIPSPYAWSSFDVCKYEPTHFVFNFPGMQPYCPAI
jgi:hypothetical protein